MKLLIKQKQQQILYKCAFPLLTDRLKGAEAPTKKSPQLIYVAAEEASFIFDGEAGSDKRQDTPFKALPAACFTDTGGQEQG